MRCLLTADQRAKLESNGRENRARQDRGELELDLYPIVKLFMPEGAMTWLLTEIDPDDGDIAFGLCDLGMGFPEIGSVSLSEIASVRTRLLRLPVERDRHFKATKPLSAYAEDARKAERITV